MWPFTKKIKPPKLIEGPQEKKPGDDAVIGALVLIDSDIYLLVDEPDDSKWLLPVFEISTDKLMYRTSGHQVKPSKATLERFGFGVGPHLDVVSDELSDPSS